MAGEEGNFTNARRSTAGCSTPIAAKGLAANELVMDLSTAATDINKVNSRDPVGRFEGSGMNPSGTPAKAKGTESARSRILRAAFEEIYRHGYQGARVDAILAETGLTKGAFYHHFTSKQDLGYAVVDEVIARVAEEVWKEALESHPDPIEGIKFALQRASTLQCLAALGIAPRPISELGCPINNLAQEMSAIDDGFRIRLSAVFATMIGWIAAALRRGQQNGTIDPAIDSDGTATFLLATFEGCIGLAKSSRDEKVFAICWQQTERFLQSLRP